MTRPLYEPSIVVVGKGVVLIPMPELFSDTHLEHGMSHSPIPTERFWDEIQRVKENKPRYAR